MNERYFIFYLSIFLTHWLAVLKTRWHSKIWQFYICMPFMIVSTMDLSHLAIWCNFVCVEAQMTSTMIQHHVIMCVCVCVRCSKPVRGSAGSKWYPRWRERKCLPPSPSNMLCRHSGRHLSFCVSSVSLCICILCICFSFCVSPWHNRIGWLGSTY